MTIFPVCTTLRDVINGRHLPLSSFYQLFPLVKIATTSWQHKYLCEASSLQYRKANVFCSMNRKLQETYSASTKQSPLTSQFYYFHFFFIVRFQMKNILDPAASASVPYIYQDHINIQNIKGFSGHRNFYQPKILLFSWTFDYNHQSLTQRTLSVWKKFGVKVQSKVRRISKSYYCKYL